MKSLIRKISPSAILSQIFAAALAYYLLLTDNCIHSSITYIVRYSHSLPLNKHLVLLGLLPIYIGVIIFGTSLLFASLNTTLQRIISAASNRKKVQNVVLDAKFEPEA